MEALAQKVLSRLRAFCKHRGLRPLDFFRDFDRLNSGRITNTQFHRALLATGFSVSSEESDSLAKLFEDKNWDGSVRYLDFCDSVLELPKGLEKEPTKDHAVSKVNLHPVKEVDVEVQARIDTFIDRLRGEVKARGLQMRGVFSDFDKQKTGFITEQQFRRSIKNVFANVEEQTYLDLIEKYKWTEEDCSGDPAALAGKVNYRAFADAVEKDIVVDSAFLFRDDEDSGLTASLEKKMLKKVAENTKPVEIKSSADVVDSLRAQLLRLRVRPREFFRDWDKRRKGVIPPTQFLRTLSQLRLTLTEAEGETLIDTYAIPSGVKYNAFCDDVEAVFDGEEELSSAQQEMSDVKISARQSQTPPYYPPLSRAEEEAANQLQLKLKGLIKGRRILLAPIFRDFDKSKRNVVTEPHFRRACNTLGLTMTVSELDLMIKRYAIRMMDSSPAVKYMDFIAAVDEAVEGSEEANEVKKKVEAKKRQAEWLQKTADSSPEKVDLDQLMGRIKQHAVTRRVRVGTFFQDFDPLRKGAISAENFRKALDMAGVKLSEDEYERLRIEYSTDIVPNGMIWPRFAREIASAEFGMDLERNPTAHSEKIQFHYSPDSDIAGRDSLPSHLQSVFDKVMDRLKKTVYERELIVDQPFRRFDKLNKGRVTQAQFQAALTYIALVPTPSADELEALLKAFAIPGTEYVSYRALSKQAYERFMDGKGNPITQKYDLGFGHEAEFAERERDVGPVEVKPVDVDELLARMKARLARNRVRIDELFSDFDRLKKGKILEGKLAAVVTSARLEVTEKELDALLARYRDPRDPGMILYKPFSDALLIADIE